MSKKILFLVIFILVLGLCGTVLATDKYTASTTINGVTANFEYKLDDSNQIVDLKCTNPADLTGNITIPGTLEGKAVVSLYEGAFKNASNITGVVFPDSIKEVSFDIFEGCANLESVNLGKLEKISFNVFKDCPKLKTITIPKTLTHGPNNFGKVFNGTTNLTSVTFEDGLTEIPGGILAGCSGITEITIPSSVTKIHECAFSNTGITEIVLPDSVKELSFDVFEGCANLESVNLGKLEKISFNVFKDCPKLKTITIPKTLINGPDNVGEVFNGTTNLTSATFENGITKIPGGILAECSGITEVTIPSSVKKIDFDAFRGTGIKEILLPESVEDIVTDAFADCASLVKITILNPKASMGVFSIQPDKDSVFKNHNEDLTIYCYEGSTAAEYAIKNNIKYVYLTKDTEKNTNEEEKTKQDNNTKQDDNKKENTDTKGKEEDNTKAKSVIPQTGETAWFVIIVLVVIAGGCVLFYKTRKYKEIK